MDPTMPTESVKKFPTVVRLHWSKIEHPVFGNAKRFVCWVCDMGNIRAEVEGEPFGPVGASVYTRRWVDKFPCGGYEIEETLMPRTEAPSAKHGKGVAEEFLIARYQIEELPWREGTDNFERYVVPRLRLTGGSYRGPHKYPEDQKEEPKNGEHAAVSVTTGEYQCVLS